MAWTSWATVKPSFAVRAMLVASVVSSAIIPTSTVEARLTRIVIEAVQPATPVAGAEPYEIVSGRFFGELDPSALSNAIITDLRSAPRNRAGRVDYSATFAIARPVAGTRANILFYDVPNRGNTMLTADPFGYVRVVSGWQGDLPDTPGLQTARVPIAKAKDGRSLTGPVLVRFIDMPGGTTTLPLVGSIGRPTARPLPVSLDTRKARLVRQSSDTAKPAVISSGDWAFADCSTTPFPGKPDPTRICLRGGFDPAQAYTLTYIGKDPLVLGMGFAMTRDLVSFLRYAKQDDAGTPNPAGTIGWAVASGTSQSGNFLRSFVHLGFNADEQGHIVFDGINPNIAARQVPLNLRFGVPGGAANLFEPGSEGTLWWSRYDDRVRGRGVSSLLDRCAASNTCPKVIETFGSAEFWGLRMSPGLVGTDAKADLPLPDNVRRYYFPSTTHGGSWTGGFPVAGDPAVPGCRLVGNPNPSLQSLRVAQQMLVAWVRDNRPPLPSASPTIAAGDLVAPTAAAMGWRAIPGTPVPDGKLNTLPDYDFGTGFDYRDVSGVIGRQPPIVRRTIPALVPRVDADGNEMAGIRSVQLQVPLGTYLGWNETSLGYARGTGCGFVGGFIPFARTEAEREAKGDTRPSLEERYRDHAGFVAQVRAVAQRQADQGWLLPADLAAVIRDAEASQVLR